MLRWRLLLAGLSLVIINAQAIAQKPAASGTLMYIGTQDQAILGARLDPDTGHISLLGQVAHVPRPTWLTVDSQRPILYSLSEIGNYDQQMGSVYNFAIDPETGALKQISKTSSGGHGATYVSYDPRVHTVFVGNFGGGQVSAIPVRPDGTLSQPSSTQTDYGHGPNAKQLNPHAH